MDWNMYRYSSTDNNDFWFPRRDEDERAEVHVRTFPVQIAGDGRTIDALCVPYNTRAEVADPPMFEPYLEEFLPGAFKGATRAPNRVLLDFEHHTSISNILGHAVELEERADGLHGRFRVTDHPDGDKALGLIRDRVLTGMSVLFKSLRHVRTEDGIVQRVKAHLDRVSLCRVGAYPTAQVLAVRTRPLPRPDPLNPDLVRSLQHFGIRVPGGTSDQDE